MRWGGLLRESANEQERVNRWGGEERERERTSMRGSGKTKKKKKILIARLHTAFTMTVYPTFLRANYLLLHESWRSFRLVVCAEYQQSSLTIHTQ